MTACRICLGEENESKDPLISPCLCSGSMKHIHVNCLKHWLNQKRTQRLGVKIQSYSWRAVECELCKTRLPFKILHKGKYIDLLDIDIPKDTEYFILESVTTQNLKIVHVVSFGQTVEVGRGMENMIRITDISVSREHAQIFWGKDKTVWVRDLNSKFGTSVQV